MELLIGLNIPKLNSILLRIHLKALFYRRGSCGIIDGLIPAVEVEVTVLIDIASLIIFSQRLTGSCERPLITLDATETHVALVVLVARVPLFQACAHCWTGKCFGILFVTGIAVNIIGAASGNAESISFAKPSILKVLVEVLGHFTGFGSVSFENLRIFLCFGWLVSAGKDPLLFRCNPRELADLKVANLIVRAQVCVN